MAHMIDFSNNTANIAYVGETPWHGLGKALTPDQPIEVWAKAAGLSHEVLDAPVMWDNGSNAGVLQRFSGKRVLYRSDTLKPLSIVSAGYNVVQPAVVWQFFDELCRHNGFTLETAGALDDGKRIWALARVNEGAPVIGQDVVRPYVLLATSYDGTMATTAKFTSIRVVCHNTLSYAAGAPGIKQGEADTERSVIRVAHSREFDPEECRLDLGIAVTAFDRFLIESRLLAKRSVGRAFAVEFLKQLLPATVSVSTAKDGTRTVTPKAPEDGRGFRSIMALFDGEAMGAGLPEANGTAWGLLNAVTQHVDWSAGRGVNSRLSSAWFGSGNALKTKARDLLMAVVA